MQQPEQPSSQSPLAGLPISRWGVGEVAVGRRVIVRRELDAEEQKETGKKATDVIGYVVSLDPFVVRPQARPGVPADDYVPAIDFSDKKLLVVKALPERTVRNSDIRAVEVATAKAFPGIRHQLVNGWLLRAGDGITERSNSALPILPSAATTPVPIDEIIEFYRSFDLPVRIALPDRIAKPAHVLTQGPNWKIGPDIVVMTRSLKEPLPEAEFPFDGLRVDIADQPDQNWLELYHFRGQALPEHALRLLREDIDGQMRFGRLLLSDAASDGISNEASSGDATNRTIAITRGTLTQSDDGRTWLGFSAVEVAEDFRRRGLGTLLGLKMMEWGAEHGADATYLQVLSGNEAGIALYRNLGFTEHHRHRYAELMD